MYALCREKLSILEVIQRGILFDITIFMVTKIFFLTLDIIIYVGTTYIMVFFICSGSRDDCQSIRLFKTTNTQTSLSDSKILF